MRRLVCASVVCKSHQGPFLIQSYEFRNSVNSLISCCEGVNEVKWFANLSPNIYLLANFEGYINWLENWALQVITDYEFGNPLISGSMRVNGVYRFVSFGPNFYQLANFEGQFYWLRIEHCKKYYQFYCGSSLQITMWLLILIQKFTFRGTLRPFYLTQVLTCKRELAI